MFLKSWEEIHEDTNNIFSEFKKKIYSIINLVNLALEQPSDKFNTVLKKGHI